MKHELITYLLGPLTIAQFLAAFIFAILGVLLKLLIESNQRTPVKTNAEGQPEPNHFKWAKLFCDNAKRITANILLIAVCIRFTPELWNAPLKMIIAFAIGFFLDYIAKYFRPIMKKVFPAANQFE